MGWKECDRVSSRREFVNLAQVEGANFAALCRQFGVSRKTGYKWLARYQAEGASGLHDQSRRPQQFRRPTPADVEAEVLKLRAEHPSWGGRKLRARLLALGAPHVPAASTITEILRRHGCLCRPGEEDQPPPGPYQRFERSVPNELWQMDFKGEFKMTNGRYCYPLTMLDDHSRFALGLFACGNQQRNTVQPHLVTLFRRYGLPQAIFVDNGPPWGSLNSPTRHTRLTAWLMRLDIKPIHGRPFYPQGRGKEERFHRTLKTELLQDRFFDDLAHTQSRFEPWRQMYNQERPHEALGLAVPASRYHTSAREYPEQLPPFEYSSRFQTRTVNRVGQFQFKGHTYRASEAFSEQRLGLCPTGQDGIWDVYYCHFRIGQLDERSGGGVVRRPRGQAAAGGGAASARYARSSGTPTEERSSNG